MREGGSIIRRAVLLLLLCLFMLGLAACTRETSFMRAGDFYAKGQYEEAEAFFLLALEEAPDDELVHLGYAYNLAQLGRKTESIDQLEPIFAETYASGKDKDLALRVGSDLLAMYLELEDYSQAALLFEKLSGIVPAEYQDYYLLQDAIIRAGLTRGDKAKLDEWEDALRDIIALKVYAADEYYELFDSYKQRNLKQDLMGLADEMIIYMNAHSAYIEDFGPLIDVLFEAAELADAAKWDNNQEYYFTAAEDFIEMAELRNLSDQDILKYKIVIAEHRGKLDLAFRLLGVYLNHYPEDAAAVKERAYLSNRLKISADN